jgi:hypothetical protein
VSSPGGSTNDLFIFDRLAGEGWYPVSFEFLDSESPPAFAGVARNDDRTSNVSTSSISSIRPEYSFVGA